MQFIYHNRRRRRRISNIYNCSNNKTDVCKLGSIQNPDSALDSVLFLVIAIIFIIVILRT